MGIRIGLIMVVVLASSAILPPAGHAQDWLQNDQIFNPSGIPSLPFSQPRFADLDADGDFDMILGSIDDPLAYYENTGTAAAPAFSAGPDIFAMVDPLDAEVGVCVDLDSDLDLDLVAGGFNGLTLFENTGDPAAPIFVESVGYFSGLATGSNPVPSFADMDGDGDLDLLVGMSESGLLKYYENTGTPTAAQFTESASQAWFDIGLYAYPWLGDLDGDLDVDLLSGRDATGFVFYRNAGDAFAWDWQPDNAVFAGLATSTYWNSPCLVDLNGDGRQDLVYGTSAGPLQYYVNTGTPADPVWTANTSLFGGVLDVGGASSPFFFDFDFDGDLDLASGSQLGDIKYYRNVGTSAAPAWQPAHDYFISIDHSIYSAIALGKLDGDDLPDAVVGDLSGNLFFHHNTGSGFTYDASVFAGVDVGAWSVPRLADMDGDGDLDLVVGNEAGTLTYFKNTGGVSMAWSLVPGYFGGIDVGSNCVPTLGDFDNDGDMDLLTGNISHQLRYFEHVGESWLEDPSVVAGLVVGQNAAPALADLDGDEDLDLTVGNYSGTFNYFENIRQPGGVSFDEPPVARRTTLQASGNPFRDSVVLTFGLCAPSQVDLAIFDAAGRRVCQLVSGLRPAGDYSIEWTGARGTTRDVGSGVYFCRLKTRDSARTIAITHMR
jgi:hypothetical protein